MFQSELLDYTKSCSVLNGSVVSVAGSYTLCGIQPVINEIGDIWSLLPSLAITPNAAFCTLGNLFMGIDGEVHIAESCTAG